MSIVTATIEKKGEALNPVYELVSIDINREVNRIPYAQLLLMNGFRSLYRPCIDIFN